MARHQAVNKTRPTIQNLSGTIFRVVQYMSDYKKLFFVVILMVIISSVLSLLGPYFLGAAVDDLIKNLDGTYLVQMIILLLVIFVLQSITTWLQNYWMITVAQNTIFSMRKHLFSHVLTLPLLFFQKRQSGDLMSRLTNDVENVSRTLNTAVIQLITSILTLVGTVVMMVVLSPLLTLLTLTIVPLMFLGMNWITKRTSVHFKKQQQQLGDINGFIEETLSGHKMIKLFSKENEVIEVFDQKNKELKHEGYWAQVYSGFIPKLMNSLNNLSFTIIVGIGALFVLNDMITIGTIVTFTTYSRQFTRPLNDLANQYNVILSAVAGAERVFAIIDEAEEEDSTKKLPDLTIKRGEVTFQSVSFSYEAGVETLKDISFRAKAGDTVALVGPTGAGKTTIISLLARFYDVNKGKIMIDHQDTAHYSRASIREQMGIVLQDSYLFDTTIKENIRYGKLDAEDEEVIAAAKAANAHSFIAQLPNGYDTILDSNGKEISHGQRQLISIARAVLADPAILILDEATSSIDTITEIKIIDAFQRLMRKRTSFVIAHRLNTIRNADLILVFDTGKLIEHGTHHELMKKKGYYYDLLTTRDGEGSLGAS
ncbi:ABC transporter ATP-binding protein [Aquibacillus salsiterrae]|uniref:ABC transporter ATP-binding protein/permease n=1 Tax=Aquibacillus salsiterrae TaxID=2950439 RepID=A0A9X3WD77_9BACI|nr:ABC transporter ATP-binding protein [Aquibacillus salsiterrae]MDC3416848.1 ABC transporter ATP-binding protein/permease [Aquibacillus salsiterrae]